MPQTDLVYAPEPSPFATPAPTPAPVQPASNGMNKTKSIGKMMTVEQEQNRLREQRSMAAKMAAVTERKKRMELAEKPTARAVPGVVERPFSMPLPEYLATNQDQQLTVFRNKYTLRLAVDSTPLERLPSDKSLQRASSENLDRVASANDHDEEEAHHHKTSQREYVDVNVRDCVIRINERSSSSFELLPEETKGHPEGATCPLCPSSVSVKEPFKFSVCQACHEAHAIPLNAAPPRPTGGDSVWHDFEIHVTSEVAADGKALPETTSATEPAELLRVATAALMDVRPVAASEDLRLIGMVSAENPSCVLIRRVLTGQVLQQLQHRPDETIQMLDLTPDGALTVASVRAQDGACAMVIWSNMSGEELLRLPQGKGKLLLANTSRDSGRIFVVKIDDDDVPELSIHFLKAGETAEAFDTAGGGGGGGGGAGTKKALESAWKSGDGSSVVFSNGIVAHRGGGGGWERFNLHHFFAYKRMQHSAEYKSVFLERVKNDSDRLVAEVRSEFGGFGPAEWRAGQPIRTFLDGSIALASLSHDGRVLANTFEMRFAGNELSQPTQTASRLVSDATHSRLEDDQCSTVGLNFFSVRVHPQLPSGAQPPHLCVLPEPSTVLVWDAEKEELMHRFNHRRPVTSVAVSGDGRLLVVGVSGTVLGRLLEQSETVIYSLVTRQCLWRLPLNAEVEAASVSMARGLTFRCFGDPERSISLRENRELTVDTADLQGRHAIAAACVTDDGKYYALKLNAVRGDVSFQAVRIGVTHRSMRHTQSDFILLPSRSDPAPTPLPHGRKGRSAAPRERLEVLEVGRATEEELRSAKPLGVMCLSSDGSVAALSVRNKCRVVVVSVSALTVLKEFHPDWEPNALCLVSEVLTVCSDEQQHTNYLPKEFHLTTYSVLTGEKLDVFESNNSGRTVGICRNGERRVQVTEDRRTVVEVTNSCEVLYDMQEPGLSCLGVSGLGTKLVMWDAQKRTLSVKDLQKFNRFGPSMRTVQLWLESGESMEETLTRHKDDLALWPLWGEDAADAPDDASEQHRSPPPFNTSRPAPASSSASHSKASRAALRKRSSTEGVGAVARAGVWSYLLSELVRRKDLAAVKVVADACPVLWAGADYVEEESGVRCTFFDRALDSNDKILSQMLLDAVTACVSSAPEQVPVLHMEQVTNFVVKAINEDKVQDRIELFLKELPLIAVPDDETMLFRARFKAGDTITRQWRTRDVSSSSFAWTIIHVQVPPMPRLSSTVIDVGSLHHLPQEEEEGQKQAERAAGAPRERGYPYVSPLPDLAKLETVEALVSASPGLLDNETMRAAIDALKHLMTPSLHLGGLKLYVNPLLLLYLLVMACFCSFVVLCSLEDSRTIAQLADTSSGRGGIVLGSLAALGNLFFLSRIAKEVAASNGWAEYFSAFWHCPGPVAHLLCVASFVLRVADESSTRVRGVSSVAVMLLFLNVFNYLRAFRELSSLVGMLIQIMKDMAYFSLVMGILILSFTAGFFCLHGGIETPLSSIFELVGHSLTRTFLMSVLGDFSAADLQSPMEASSQALSNISYVFFFFLVFLVSIVGMNALIAIMGNTFAEVTDREQAVQYHEISAVLLDQMRLMSPQERRKFAQKNRWTHVLSPSENGSMPEGGTFGGERGNPIVTLKKDLKDSTTLQHDHIEAVKTAHEELKVVSEDAASGEDITELSRVMAEAAGTAGAVQDEVDNVQEQLALMRKQLDANRKRITELTELAATEPEWARTLRAEIQKLEDVDPLLSLYPPWATGLSARLNAAASVEMILEGEDKSRLPEWARRLDQRVTALEIKDRALKKLEDGIDLLLDRLTKHVYAGGGIRPTGPASRTASASGARRN